MRMMIHSEFLKTTGTDWSDKALTAGTDYYSDAIESKFSNGNAALRFDLAADSNVTISYETSLNGADWYAPINTSGESLTEIVTTLTSASAMTKWVVFSPQ